MKVISVRRRNGGLGFKRVNWMQWALSKLFPYRLPSRLGLLLVCRKAITVHPGSALRD